jgi:succinate-semialdehyde dehydrogenase/glutarate-semialdehyde dehydrogenase
VKLWADGQGSRRTHGPLIHARAVEKVEAHVGDALARGAALLVGGERLPGPGTFYAPTVLADVPPDARINTEETFGPVAPLVKFETEEEVIKLANDTDVGLAGYFYSRDVGRVWRVAEAVSRGRWRAGRSALTGAVCSLRSEWSARTRARSRRRSSRSAASRRAASVRAPATRYLRPGD